MTDFERWFRDAVAERSSPLSEAGAARRQAMRVALTGVVVRRRRLRRAGRGAAALALLAGVVWLAWWSSGTATPVAEQQDVVHDAAPTLHHIALEIVADDPDILARCAAPSRELPPETWIDDQQLLQLLRDADRPTGLLRRGNRVELTEDVTDELGE